MSVHVPIPSGEALNPPFSDQHLQTINLLCHPCHLLDPLASTGVNAMLIQGITSAPAGRIFNLQLRALPTMHSDTTSVGIYSTKMLEFGSVLLGKAPAVFE